MSDSERLLDLLTSRATEGLSAEDSQELERALRQQTDVEADDLDLAAAAADRAFASLDSESEPMPAELKQRLLERALAGAAPKSDVVPFADRTKRKTSPLGIRYLGWYAAAAMLVLALWAPWSPRPPAPTTSAPTLAEQRARLMQEAPDLVRVAWATPEIDEYVGVRGDVVWSNARQAGFMRLRGLPANRPGLEQYQLWIVDPSRDTHPIDGGVFDVADGADEVLVPIDAKLDVNDPQVFAITLEQTGGVVVSDGPLLVVAAVEA